MQSTVTLNIGLTTSKNHFIESQRGLPIFTTDVEVAALTEWVHRRIDDLCTVACFASRVDTSGNERTLIVEYTSLTRLHYITLTTQTIADMLFQDCIAQRVTTHQDVVEKLVGSFASEWGTFNKEYFKDY